MADNPIITFTSDFGSREHYVGAVKGVLLGACPNATIVDISHDVGSHDLLEAAFVIAAAYPFFPARTVHLVVVDPTVGSSRRGIIACTESAFFVAPDNGVLSLVYANEPSVRVVAIEADHYFRKPVSATFHGRDVFAPVAGRLAAGTDFENFGPLTTDYVRFALPPVHKVAENKLEGIVLHIDKFGNAITNITPKEVKRLTGREAHPAIVRINGKEITGFRRYYTESSADEFFSLLGSTGYYEIAAAKKPAARLLEIKRGNKVEVEIK
ncbi:MAG: S-adenosyl-l-methionine hydroxide adenosyltransferase family protein [Acidobacteriota bacterium]